MSTYVTGMGLPCRLQGGQGLPFPGIIQGMGSGALGLGQGAAGPGAFASGTGASTYSLAAGSLRIISNSAMKACDWAAARLISARNRAAVLAGDLTMAFGDRPEVLAHAAAIMIPSAIAAAGGIKAAALGFTSDKKDIEGAKAASADPEAAGEFPEGEEPPARRTARGKFTSTFPEQFRPLLHSLSDVAFSELISFYLSPEGRAMTQMLENLCVIEHGHPGFSNLVLESSRLIHELGKIDARIVHARLASAVYQEGNYRFFGVAHEFIRMAMILGDGRGITHIEHEFAGRDGRGIEFAGWLDAKWGARIIPIGLKGKKLQQTLTADAYDDKTGTVYEIKSIYNGSGPAVMRIIGLIANSPNDVISNVPIDSHTRNAVLFCNQMRKLGAAVQQGFVGAVEVHLTTNRELPPAMLRFIQQAIPNVRIVVYGDILEPRSRSREIPESTEFAWLPAVPGSPNRYELKMRRSADDPRIVRRPSEFGGDEVFISDEPRDASETSTISALNRIFGSADELLTKSEISGIASRSIAEWRDRLLGISDDAMGELSALVSHKDSLGRYIGHLKNKVMEIGSIPFELDERRAYADRLVDTIDEVMFIEGLAKTWTEASSAFTELSRRFSTEEEITAALPHLYDVADVIRDFERALVEEPLGCVVGVIEELEKLIRQIDDAKARLDATQKHAGFRLDAFLDIKRPVDFASYRDMLSRFRDAGIGVPPDLTGVDRYNGVLAGLESDLDELAASINHLTPETEEAWIDRYDSVARQSSLAWELNDTIAKVVMLRDDPGAMTAQAANIEFFLAGVDSIGEDSRFPDVQTRAIALTDAKLLGDNIRIDAYANSMVGRRAVLFTYAQIALRQRLLEDGIQYKDSDRMIRAFADDLGVDDAIILTSGNMLAVDPASDIGIRATARIGSLFDSWRDANQNFLDVAPPEVEEPWKDIKDKDVMKWLDGALRSADFRSRDKIDWDRHHVKSLKRFHVKNVINSMIRNLARAGEDEVHPECRHARELCTELNRFVIEFVQNSTIGDFNIRQHKERLFGYARRYLWIMNGSN